MSTELSRPSLGLHLTELWRANKERLQAQTLIRKVKPEARNRHTPILVIPGFMASEVSTKPLRSLLIKLGYNVYDWGLGRNYARLEDLDDLTSLLIKIAEETGKKVTIIGWSLGGIYARRLAVTHPQLLQRVITLGSPYKHIKSPNYATWLFELFQKMRYNSTQEPEWIAELSRPIEVPSTAIYTKSDGIVPWKATMDPDDPTDHENIEVISSHIALGANEEVLLHIIRILEADESELTQSID